MHTRSASFFKRFSAKLFYKFFNACTSIKIDANAADFRLLDRKVVNVFKMDIRERTRFLRGLTAWVGFRTCSVAYNAEKRHAGSSKYSLRKMLLLAVDGICSFSALPLYAGVVIGFLLSIAGFFYAVFAVVEKYMYNKNVPGWTSLVILITIIGGIQLILMGILGIYIGKIYEETKQRPIYLVRSSLGFNA